MDERVEIMAQAYSDWRLAIDEGVFDAPTLEEHVLYALESAGYTVAKLEQVGNENLYWKIGDTHLLQRVPRPFMLIRDVDETGVSGCGPVAEGVQFSDGTVALRWTSEWPTSVVFHERGVDAVLAVHGHGGKTRIEWL